MIGGNANLPGHGRMNASSHPARPGLKVGWFSDCGIRVAENGSPESHDLILYFIDFGPARLRAPQAASEGGSCSAPSKGRLQISTFQFDMYHYRSENVDRRSRALSPYSSNASHETSKVSSKSLSPLICHSVVGLASVDSFVVGFQMGFEEA